MDFITDISEFIQSSTVYLKGAAFIQSLCLMPVMFFFAKAI